MDINNANILKALNIPPELNSNSIDRIEKKSKREKMKNKKEKGV